MLAADLEALSLRPSVRAALRAAREALERLYGDRLVKLILFGSQARGDAHEESDVDVLLVLPDGFRHYDEIKRTGDIVLEASLNHQVFLSIIPIEETRFNDPAHPLMMNIKEEGIEL